MEYTEMNKNDLSKYLDFMFREIKDKVLEWYPLDNVYSKDELFNAYSEELTNRLCEKLYDDETNLYAHASVINNLVEFRDCITHEVIYSSKFFIRTLIKEQNNKQFYKVDRYIFPVKK